MMNQYFFLNSKTVKPTKSPHVTKSTSWLNKESTIVNNKGNLMHTNKKNLITYL